MKHRIVFLDRETLEAEVRRPDIEHEWEEFPNTAASDVVNRLRGATIAITNKVPIRRDSLAALPDLEHVAVAATGLDNVDLEACREHGVSVSHIQNYAVRAVPEHTMMLALALRRNLVPYLQEVRMGAWNRATTFCLFNHSIGDLHGATMGIVGYGSIGRGTAELARAFGMQVLVAERKGASAIRSDRVPFTEVLERADVLSLHCALTRETEDLIGAEELSAMKPTAVLINTARGGLIDEMALNQALHTGTIAGAAVDVLREEPPKKPSPLQGLDFRKMLITPHVAWASARAMQNLADQLTENIEAFSKNVPKRLAVG